MTDPTLPTPSGEPTPATAASAPTPAAAPAPKRSTRWITPTLAIVAALAVGVVGGVFIGRSGAAQAGPAGFTRGQFANGQFGGGQQGGGARGGQQGTGGGFAGGGFTSGTIVSVDGTTIKIKAQDGSEKTVTTSGDTKVTKTEASSVSELKKGETITVIGQAGSDGSVTATTISEGAGLRGGFGGRPGSGATPPSSDSGN